MSEELSKTYDPSAVEDKWYRFWQESGCFTADPESSKPPYSIVIPPPNVTGILHMGHVLNNTIQDILARKARMDGKEVLWLPGTDHAGIATQVMVEKKLKKEEGRSRHDIGREKFLEHVWEWKEKHGGIIINQLKKLGCSCDWTRERFTMDADYSKCVQKVFVELYKKGLIYRGKRMVNWCPASLTALSDEEVEMTPQKGSFYTFRVQVFEPNGEPMKATPDMAQLPTPPSEDEEAEAEQKEEELPSGPLADAEANVWLLIGTTRPETIPGDTGVAVNPKDERYAAFIGKRVRRPLPAADQALLPVVGDEHVDFEFGTGVLKVTPAHDKADFEIGQRHGLEAIDTMNPDGSMNALAGTELAGMDRFDARKKAAELLAEAGVLIEEKPYENNVGFSERAKVPIEPRLSEQWFLKYPSVEASTKCIEHDEANAPSAGKMRFHPQRWAKTYDHWMTGIQDWCVSRQLWWGHRIPVWQKRIRVTQDNWADELMPWGWDCWVSGHWQALESDGPDHAIFMRVVRVADGIEIDPRQQPLTPALKEDEGEYDFFMTTLSPAWAAEFEKHGFTQDPDVLDTWFSSWLWPFATMGWPDETATLKKFYPTTDLVTGPDIIFFWVARMIMAGYEFMGDLPFENVYFTGIIRDKKGRKMSKTLGNSPDPLELIGKYSADALRFGTMRGAPLGLDVLFDEKDVELGRNFCTKLWNACRFRQMQGVEVEGEIRPQLLTSDDKWILIKLDRAIREITDAFSNYRFNEAVQTLYRFFWSEFCAWYIEATKAALFGDDEAIRTNTLAVMDFVFSNTLRLFHPFIPFITEELWQGMGFNKDLPEGQGGKTIMYANWPKAFDEDFRAHYGLDDVNEQLAEAKYALVASARSLRQQFGIASNVKVRFILKPNAELPAHEIAVMRILLNAEPLDVDMNFAGNKTAPSVSSAFGDLFLPLEGVIDFEKERTRLKKQLEKIGKEIEKVKFKLDNPGFCSKVPAEVLEEHKQRLVDWQAEHKRVSEAVAALEE